MLYIQTRNSVYRVNGTHVQVERVAGHPLGEREVFPITGMLFRTSGVEFTTESGRLTTSAVVQAVLA